MKFANDKIFLNTIFREILFSLHYFICYIFLIDWSNMCEYLLKFHTGNDFYSFSRWCQEVTFKIEQNKANKIVFLKNTFGKNVSRAKIKLDSLSWECVLEFISLLELLKGNNKLSSIILEPSHCRLEHPSDSR